MYDSYSGTTAGKVKRRSLAALMLIAFLAFLVAVAGVLAFYFLPNPDLLFQTKRDEKPDIQAVTLSILDSEVVIPSNLIARVKRRPLGSIQRIDMILPWPNVADADKTWAEDATNLDHNLLLSFSERGDAPTQQHLYDKVYRYYYDGKPQESVAGLVRHDFRPATPYSDVQLYVGKLDDVLAFIKCDLQQSSLGPKICERTIPASNELVLRYRFSANHLKDWKLIDATIARILSEIVFNRGNRNAPQD